MWGRLCGTGTVLFYFVPRFEALRDLDVVVVGDGDSAVDWALALQNVAAPVTLVHRRREFRAHAHSVAKVQSSPVRIILDAHVSGMCGAERVESVLITLRRWSEPIELAAQAVVAALGFVADLGPLRSWGLDLDGMHIAMDRSMGTSIQGVYAAGDIAAYPGKVKLISVGFGEVATAVNNAAAHLQPEIGLDPGHSSDQVRGPALLYSPCRVYRLWRCEPACPVEAIRPRQRLPDGWKPFQETAEELFQAIGSPGGSRNITESLPDPAFVGGYVKTAQENER
jgi:hypothetical protein